MSKKIKIEDLLYKLSKDNPEGMRQIDVIDEAVFERIKNNAYEKAFGDKKKNIGKVFFKISAAVTVSVVLLAMAVLFLDTPSSNAYKNSIQKLTYNVTDSNGNISYSSYNQEIRNAVDEIQSFVPFDIPMPGIIPEGYSFKYIDYNQSADNSYTVEYQYFMDDARVIDFLISDVPFAQIPEGKEVLVNIVYTVVTIYSSDINGMKYYSATFTHPDGTYVKIGGFTSEDGLIEIITNFDGIIPQ